MAKVHRRPIESGCPDGFQYMHPLMRKNYGLSKKMEERFILKNLNLQKMILFHGEIITEIKLQDTNLVSINISHLMVMMYL